MKLPEMVYKPAFAVTRASHVAIRVRDLQASRAFYVDLLGFMISDENRDTIWLRGLEEGCHHSLVLRQGDPACEHFGMRVLTEEDLELAKTHFSSAGLPTRWVEVEHQGKTFQTVDPAGTKLEFSPPWKRVQGSSITSKPTAVRESNASITHKSLRQRSPSRSPSTWAWDSDCQNMSSMPITRSRYSFSFSAKAILTTSFSQRATAPVSITLLTPCQRPCNS